ncbi:MAG: hypothetical protein QME49_01610 [bacterium]|nr:hypothetical protein [bacterium]
MLKQIFLLIIISIIFNSECYAANTQTEIIYGAQKARVIDGKLLVETTGSSTMNIGTIAAFAMPIWEATPPTKAYQFEINLIANGSSTTLFTIGTPVAGYRAFIEYITMVRDESQPLGYMNLQLVDNIKNTLLIGGEIAPAYTVSMLTPPTPLIATNCKIILQEKGGYSQKIKISCIVSVRKVSDMIFDQPY